MSEAKPVLFLDIDGVMNCEATFINHEYRGYAICRKRVALLNEIVAATGCRITMSSVWRLGLPDVRRLLRRRGLRARFSRDWRTPYFDHTAPDRRRGAEIADWLGRNGSPPYAIVDDDSDMLPEQRPRFVQTTIKNGLDREAADRLITLLSVQTETSHAR